MSFRTVLLGGLLLAAWGCGEGQEADPGSTIVLVTVDAWRADRLELYGGQVALPALDRLAARGIVLDDLSTVVPMTRPAAATILTGQLPPHHRIRNDVSDRLDPDSTTLPSRLEDAGFATAAFVGSGINSWSSGFQHQFDLFDGPEDLALGPGAYAPPVRPAAATLDHFESWMNGSQADRRFAWIHLAELQDAATDAQRGQAQTEYDTALAALEQPLDRLQAFLEGWSEERGAVDVILAGTYGVHLEDPEVDGARGSSYWLDRATLHVPALVARIGGDPGPGGRFADPCWLPDLTATIESLAGVPTASGHGIDLLQDGAAAGRTLYAWSWAPSDELGWPALTAVRDGSGWRNLDPAGNGAAASADLLAEAREHRLSDEHRRALQEAGIRLGETDQASPPLAGKDKAAFLSELFHVRHHFANGRERRVARTTRRMVEAQPENLATLYNRAVFILMAGSVEPAEEFFTAMLERYPDTPEVLHWAAHVHLAKQETAAAFALLQAAQSLGFTDADLLYDTACVHAVQGDRQAALESLGAAIDAGYRNWEWIDQDPDLASLRADPAYARLMSAKGR